jgi:tRNA uridine 5-carboxymethylaminomethyl modification enzyme
MEKAIIRYVVGEPDVLVIGGGHAGIEASLATARMGVKTVLLTLQPDAVGNMPCNPSIGGTGKGQLVFELDALGGEMGRVADQVCLQSRMLNASKGPAVHSLRMQSDRMRYRAHMKTILENTPNLSLIQGEAVDVYREGNLWYVATRLGAVYGCKAVIIATGTYLDSRIIVGESFYSAGPDNSIAAIGLTDSLKKLGIKFFRFKTGTPPRLHRDSIHYEKTESQEGDMPPVCFSSLTDKEAFRDRPQKKCHVVYTNEKTHAIIRANLHRSPLYSGVIKGTGPRYCPSLEDKIVRFPDKERHQVFLEPMGEDTVEIYAQGLSSSLPEDVQREVVHSIEGLEDAVFIRAAYAIEYDCIDPLQLRPTMEIQDYPGLYGAGQFNGTSGYEEAAAQGIVAGINAALQIQGKESLVLPRSSSYIGTLIDDLVTKGTNEPYRMMTSRCEYRLVLRQDNADRRLSEIGLRMGLLSKERYNEKQKIFAYIDEEVERAETTFLPPGEALNAMLASTENPPVHTGVRLGDLLRRPGIGYKMITPLDIHRPDYGEYQEEVFEKAEIEIKYAGYIKRQNKEIEACRKLENKRLPPDLPYKSIQGLRLEAAAKLEAIRPESLGQASRISGVSPADITVLLLYLNH